MSKTVSELLNAAKHSVDDLRKRISNVKYGAIINGKETITFNLDNEKYIGILSGRNADLVLGHGVDYDKSIAVRVLVDGGAKSTMKKNPRPRIGKKKPTRPSTATGKRASKRLVARRKRNGKKGFFPNPIKSGPFYVQESFNRGKTWKTIKQYPSHIAHLPGAKSYAKEMKILNPHMSFRVITK